MLQFQFEILRNIGYFFSCVTQTDFDSLTYKKDAKYKLQRNANWCTKINYLSHNSPKYLEWNLA